MPEENNNVIVNGEYTEELRVNGHKAFVEVARRDARGHIIDKFYIPAARAQEKLVAGKNIASINGVALTTPTNFQVYSKDEVYTKNEMDYYLNDKISLKPVSSLPVHDEAIENALYLLTTDQSLYIYSNRTWIRVGISLPSTPLESGNYALMCSVSNSGAVEYMWGNAALNNNPDNPDEPDEPVEYRLIEIYVQSQPRIRVYEIGDTFSTNGISIKAVYSGSDMDVDVTSSVVFSTPDMSTAGEKTITCTYTDGNGDSAETTFTITVNAPVVEIEELDDGSRNYILTFNANEASKDGVNVPNSGIEEPTHYNTTLDAANELDNFAITVNQSVQVLAMHGLKIGSGSKTGSFTISFDNGNEADIETVHVYAYKYGTESSARIKITDGDGVSQTTENAIVAEATEEITNVSAEGENDFKFSIGKSINSLTIETSGGKRAYISKVKFTVGKVNNN